MAKQQLHQVPNQEPKEGTALATHEKFRRLAIWKGKRSLEHTVSIRLLDLCTVTGRHGFLVGAKGAAKSQLVRDTARCLEGASYHEDLMHAEKAMRDLLGVYMDIGHLSKNHEFRYTAAFDSPVHQVDPASLADGTHVCPDFGLRYIDETFNGSLNALNGLNSLLHEGFARQGPQVFHTNRTTIGTGNAIKNFATASESDTKLQTGGALWDRFLLRDRIRPFVRAQASKDEMHTMPVDQLRANTPPLLITRDELETMRRTARLMVTREDAGGTAATTYPKAIRRKVDKIVDAVRKKGIPLSDRRWPWAREILAANALLCGRTVINEQDLKTARWWAWEAPEQINMVLEVLQDLIEMAHPKVVKEEIACGKVYQELLDMATADPEMMKPDSPKAAVRVAKGNQVSSKLSDSIRTLERMMETFPDEADEIRGAVEGIKGWNRDILQRFSGIMGLED